MRGHNEAPVLEAHLDPAPMITLALERTAKRLDPQALPFRIVRPVGWTAPWPRADALERALHALDGTFTEVGESFRLGERFSWRFNPSDDIEWLIAHHKFGVAVDLAHAYERVGDSRFVERLAALVSTWLAEMGSGFITASDAQVEAKRLEHWIDSLLLLDRSGGLAHLEASLLGALEGRIADEVDYVLANLRPARNHRTFQLFAVFLAALAFPHLSSASAWRTVAHRSLCANLLSDFGPDGVHIELSTHYHQITLERAMVFVALAEGVGMPVPAELDRRLQAALRFSAWFTLPDGGMPLIGDADAGDHRQLQLAGSARYDDPEIAWPIEWRWPADRNLPLSRWFPDAGYLVARGALDAGAGGSVGAQHLFYDCGGLGVGSHAHYDLFNVCFAVNGRALLVDPGRYTYNAEADDAGVDWRYLFKRTAAHNTLCIDQRDQTRYLSKARRPAAGLERLDRAKHPSKHGPAAAVLDRRMMLGRRSDWIWASARSHEYRPIHRRLLFYAQRNYLCIVDDVTSEDGARHHAASHLHLAAEWLDRCVMNPRGAGVELSGEGWTIHQIARDAAFALESGWVSHSYGQKVPAPVLEARIESSRRMWFVTVIAPAVAPFAIHSVTVRELTEGGLQVTVDGHARSSPFNDMLRVVWDGPCRWDAGDHSCTSDLIYARRVDGRIHDLVMANPRAHAVAAHHELRRTPEGHVEW
jgi:Heparinase II/III-like protein/Heparinase II/III N-terminus